MEQAVVDSNLHFDAAGYWLLLVFIIFLVLGLTLWKRARRAGATIEMENPAEPDLTADDAFVKQLTTHRLQTHNRTNASDRTEEDGDNPKTTWAWLTSSPTKDDVKDLLPGLVTGFIITGLSLFFSIVPVTALVVDFGPILSYIPDWLVLTLGLCVLPIYGIPLILGILCLLRCVRIVVY